MSDTFTGDPDPSFDCLERGHIWMCADYHGQLWTRAPDASIAGGRAWPADDRLAAAAWCPWCGTGSINSDLVVPETGTAVPWFADLVRRQA